MLSKLKTIICSVLVFCLGLGTIVVANQSQPLELKIDEAFSIALEHNLNFQIDTLDWQQAKAKLNRAQIVGDEEMLLEAEEEWEKAEKLYADKIQDLQDLVRTTYQELLKSETNLENARIAQERATKQLDMDQNKYKAGLLSTLDIERAENSLFDANYAQEKAQLDLETQSMKFNEILGLPFEQKVILTERLMLDFVPFTFDLETCYELALKIDSSIISAQESFEEAKEEVLVAQGPFTPRVELEQALVRQEKAQIKLQQAKQALYFRIRSDYYALLNQAHNLEVAERNIKLERQTLQAEESKYAAGVLSNAQIVAQQEKLAQLEQSYSDSLLNYSLARLKLLQAIGKEESWGEQNED